MVNQCVHQFRHGDSTSKRLRPRPTKPIVIYRCSWRWVVWNVTTRCWLMAGPWTGKLRHNSIGGEFFSKRLREGLEIRLQEQWHISFFGMYPATNMVFTNMGSLMWSHPTGRSFEISQASTCHKGWRSRQALLDRGRVFLREASCQMIAHQAKASDCPFLSFWGPKSHTG